MKRLYFTFTILLLIVSATSAQTKITAKDAANYIGKTVTICDKVYGTKLITSSDMTLLNLGGNYPNQLLAIVIRVNDKYKFAGKTELLYKGKNICVTGEVVDYKGKPEIVVSDPQQITVDNR